ncbi:phosphatidylinositol mannoside acyltransferase [Rhodococcus olei]|uniref:Phosphatidylinositol mannoside acyltransferase n=1 Tax=Rhodococcus olei TaxID=2161675 RepID=A0ABP8PFD7_9NOCA
MASSGRVSALGYIAGWHVVRALPSRIATDLFDCGADIAARKSGPEQLRHNLARVLRVTPTDVPHEMIRASMRSYARYWKEVFRLPSMNPAQVTASIDASVQGREHLEAAVRRGHGAVLALPHSGNWDLAGVWLVHHHGKVTTVAERLQPESLFRRFVRYREQLGFEVLPVSGGQRPPFEALADRLREGRIVGLLAERDLTAHGVPVSFFGEETRMPPGPAKLADHTGAPLLPVHCWNTDSGWGFKIEPPLDVSAGVAATTQALADRFAANITEHPADWHMLQPLWVSDLPESRRSRPE